MNSRCPGAKTCIVYRAMSIHRFPINRSYSRTISDAQLNWLFRVLDGHPNAKKRDIIQRAATPAVGFIDNATAAELIRDLGLEGF